MSVKQSCRSSWVRTCVHHIDTLFRLPHLRAPISNELCAKARRSLCTGAVPMTSGLRGESVMDSVRMPGVRLDFADGTTPRLELDGRAR